MKDKRPKFGSEYWYWHNKEIMDDKEYPAKSIWINYFDDSERYDTGNCYKTKELCIKYKGRKEPKWK